MAKKYSNSTRKVKGGWVTGRRKKNGTKCKPYRRKASSRKVKPPKTCVEYW